MITMYVRSGGGTSHKGLKKGKGTKSGKGLKKAALVALKNEKGEIVIGHSKWHKKLDKYDPKHGMSIAVSRAKKDSKTIIATSLIPHLAAFIARAEKYFKTDVFSESTLPLIEASKARTLRHKQATDKRKIIIEEKAAAALV